MRRSHNGNAPFPRHRVAEFAGQLFFRLWRASHTRIAEALESIGLTPALFGVLNVLGAREGAIQQEIGSAMGIDPQHDGLADRSARERGLAKRRPSATDRRAREVVITPKGRRLLSALGRWLRGRGRGAAGLTAGERRELLALLRRALDSAPAQPLWSAEEGD